ncbi:glycosyltransferase family 9 protein [Desulfurispira natronophila]|uniref:Heptosyltransferase-2 n=1 Tax=Desulfurispira natronophila TaxID=682562 RepID=A0A7W7Y4B0_9BACT|nr:glycosyltransferase family 9 protein [Desulfurispira natronophila]MBB5021846.1 heptosyltransferase-2 [Desulfurispira natronophila]
MSTLIFLPQNIPDICRAILALKGLQGNPRFDGELTLAVWEPQHRFVRASQIGDHIIEIDSDKSIRNIWRLRKKHYTNIIDLDGSGESSRYARWARRKAPAWGFGNLTAAVQKRYTSTVKFPVTRPAREYRYHQLLKQATGIHSFALAPSFTVDSEEVERGSHFARQLTRPVIVAIRGWWPSMQWPQEHFVEVGQWLIERGHTPVFVGSREDAPAATAIIEELGVGVSLCGNNTLESLAGMLAVSGCFIGVQSDAMYIADSLGVKVAGIFGPTSLTQEGPVNSRATCLESSIKCAPCYLEQCSTDSSCSNHILPEDMITLLDSFELSGREMDSEGLS